jgi:hydrogenase large subunit
MTTLTIDPITRLEGHLKVEVTLDASNTVTDARVTGSLYRGFENILINRLPKDAAFLTQRICGVCPVPHAVASAKAVEKAKGFSPNLQALLLRNLILGANFIDSNILHFYHLALMDFVQGPQMSPWAPGYSQDFRFSAADTQALVGSYVAALAIRRKAHEMGAIFCGKLPHAANVVPGGVTARPTSTDIANFRSYLNDIQTFITNTYQADVNKLAATYNDYYTVGVGYQNLITFGGFDTNTSGGLLFQPGTMSGGIIRSFDPANIREDVKYSWYASPSGQPPASGTTTPNFEKSGAYTWLKAPRYQTLPYEAGPLARAWMNNEYRRGISVMDRHVARYIETANLAASMQTWLNQLVAGASAFTDIGNPVGGSGWGLIEAPRGALGHWVSVNNSKVALYQVITPTCWNASPMDDNNSPGPIEKAMIGTHVANADQPVELLRIVHSYDPCTACAVHVMAPEGVEMSRFVVQPVGLPL